MSGGRRSGEGCCCSHQLGALGTGGAAESVSGVPCQGREGTSPTAAHHCCQPNLTPPRTPGPQAGGWREGRASGLQPSKVEAERE